MNKQNCGRLLLGIGLMTVLSLTACSPKNNADTGNLPVVNWKMSHTQAPTHPMNISYEKMAAYVKEKTNGKFVIDIYHSGTLGAEQEVIENMQLGTIAGNLSAASLLANFVPAYNLFALPAVFANEQQLYDAMHDEEIVGKLNAACEEAGIINYGYFQNFFRSLYTKKEVKKLSDFTGLKVRVMGSAPFIATFQQLGCNPTTTAWGELYSALQLGVCEGMDHVSGSVMASAFYENLSYITAPKLFTSPMFVVISKPMYDKLPKQYQEILDEAINTILLPDLSSNSDQSEKDAFKFLTTEGKMTFVDCDIEAIHKQVAPVRDKFLAEMEPWIQDLGKKIIAKNSK